MKRKTRKKPVPLLKRDDIADSELKPILKQIIKKHKDALKRLART